MLERDETEQMGIALAAVDTEARLRTSDRLGLIGLA
jgi:hypothetical protein